MLPNQADPGFELSLSFWELMIGPLLSFILGATFLYSTNIDWQLYSSTAQAAVVQGMIWGIVTFALIVLVTRLPFSTSLRHICRRLIPLFKEKNNAQIIILSLAAGIGEELLFRGFLQQWIAGYLSIEAGISLAALGFGALHFFSTSYFLLTTVLGLLFGIMYHQTNSLLMVMSWHAFYDMLVLWVFRTRPKWLGIE